MEDWKQTFRLMKQPSGMITIEDKISGQMAHFTPHNRLRDECPRMSLLYRLLHQLHEEQEEATNEQEIRTPAEAQDAGKDQKP